MLLPGLDAAPKVDCVDPNKGVDDVFCRDDEAPLNADALDCEKLKLGVCRKYHTQTV